MSISTSYSSRSLAWIGTLLALTGAGCSAEQKAPEIFLLPEDYRGAFYVVYNIPEGTSPTFEDGVPVHDIPESGVLLTQADIRPGSVRDDQFFYESDDGSRERIEGRWTTSFSDTAEHRSDDTIYIFGEYLVEYGYTQDCRIYYSDFYVGTKTQALEGVGQFELFRRQGAGENPPKEVRDACDKEDR